MSADPIAADPDPISVGAALPAAGGFAFCLQAESAKRQTSNHFVIDMIRFYTVPTTVQGSAIF
jgi:hypothetical protein